MGMSQTTFGSRNTGSRNKTRRSRAPMSEINVTPFVDVMLVLLIIFMVTAPMITAGIPVDLPKTKASTMSEKGEPVSLTLTSNGDLYLQDTKIDLSKLIEKLNAIMAANPTTQIFIRGDKDLPYGSVMSLMGTLNSHGFSRVALLAELPKPPTQPKGR